MFIAQLHRRARLLSENFQKAVVDVVVAHEKKANTLAGLSNKAISLGISANEIVEAVVSESVHMDHVQNPNRQSQNESEPPELELPKNSPKLNPLMTEMPTGVVGTNFRRSEDSSQSQDSTRYFRPVGPNIRARLGLASSCSAHFTECFTDVGGGVCSVQVLCSFDDGDGIIEVRKLIEPECWIFVAFFLQLEA